MGVNWAGSLLGFVGCALVPIPIIFYRYGHKLRAKSKFAPTFSPAPEAVAEGHED
jgi:DHA1 family multidrug resistance protein-like MFS transporter